MKYKILNNIKDNESGWRKFAYANTLICFLSILVTLYFAKEFYAETKNSAYIIERGIRLDVARVESTKESMSLLMEGHIRVFHEMFFGLEPDKAHIKRNIEEIALEWIDESGVRLYTQLQEQNYYTQIEYSGYSTEVFKDSINVDYSRYPYKFEFFGKQVMRKNDQKLIRTLVTKGVISETNRNVKNLNGMLIRDFKVVDNSNLN